MIAFFDTNIYIDYLKGIFPKETYDHYFESFIMRLCPVVYQELIRGIRSVSLREKVDTITKKIIFLSPPTHEMWIRAGELAGKVIGSYDPRSLERAQNDLLIALTARHHGALLITQDRHFKVIQKQIPLKLDLLSFGL